MVMTLSLSGVSAQDGLVDQTLFMTFVPNIQFAPVYVGNEKGYYAVNGINLDIQHGDEPDGVNLIAAGQLQFGIISGEQVILARANERPVVFVYEWFQQYPVGIVVPADSDIHSVADLAGHKVGIPGLFGASYSGLVALLSANGMQESDINLEAIGYNAPEVMCVGGVEAAVVYINNEPAQIENQCMDVRVFPVSDAADLVSNGLVTNEDTIANNPDLVRGMVSAFDAGLRAVINNPAEAYLLSANYVDNLPLSADFRAALTTAAAEQQTFLATNPSRADIAASRALLREQLATQFDTDTLVQFDVLLRTIDMWDADQLGVTDPASWTVTQDTLLTMGFLNAPSVDLAAAYTNDFLPVMTEG